MTKEPTGETARRSTVVAIDSFAGTGPHGRPIVVSRGEVIDADDPIARMFARYFAPTGLSDSEYARLRAERSDARDLANAAYVARLEGAAR